MVKAPRLCWALHTEHLQPSRGGGRGSVDVLASGGRGAEEREGGGGYVECRECDFCLQ